MLYVQMTDKFMSGWGKAKGMKNILVFHCKDREEAEIVKENAEARSDMTDIKITDKMLEGRQNCLVQQKTIDSYSNWYRKGYFKEEK